MSLKSDQLEVSGSVYVSIIAANVVIMYSIS